MPKMPLFPPPNAGQALDLQTDAAASFQSVAEQMQNVEIFSLIVEKYVAQLLVDNVGKFVEMIIPKILGDSDFISGISNIASGVASGSSMSNIASAIGNPTDLTVKIALKDYLSTYFNLTPTTNIE